MLLSSKINIFFYFCLFDVCYFDIEMLVMCVSILAVLWDDRSILKIEQQYLYYCIIMQVFSGGGNKIGFDVPFISSGYIGKVHQYLLSTTRRI